MRPASGSRSLECLPRLILKGHSRAWRLATFGLCALALGTIVQCGGHPSSRKSGEVSQPDSKRPERLSFGPWQVVDGETDSGLAGLTVYHQGPRPPELESRAPVELPAASSASPGRGTVIAEVVISPTGRIARARILRAPELEGLADAVLVALRKWRFQPARLDGKPVAVYYTVTLPLADRNAV